MLRDIFCKVIDNHGDIGVCWRLAVQLARRGERVRLWVDEPSALAWMAPGGEPGVEVFRWETGTLFPEPGDMVIEAFGCELDEAFVAAIAGKARRKGRQPAWINLEYLSAEKFVERSHGLPSPVSAGPGQGLVKHFFYPGFTARTGGLLREPDLLQRQAAFDKDAWLAAQGVQGSGRVVTLFCYEPPALDPLLDQLAAAPGPTRLLVTAGRAAAAVRTAVENKKGLQPRWNGGSLLSISYLPLLAQADFDHLLWAGDLNLVRGEDSLVRALWAGKPFVWQIYPQHDNAHHAKLHAFLDWLGAPASLRRFHDAWNGIGPQALEAPDLVEWQACVTRARNSALGQPDLASQLAGWVRRGPA